MVIASKGSVSCARNAIICLDQLVDGGAGQEVEAEQGAGRPVQGQKAAQALLGGIVAAGQGPAEEAEGEAAVVAGEQLPLGVVRVQAQQARHPVGGDTVAHAGAPSTRGGAVELSGRHLGTAPPGAHGSWSNEDAHDQGGGQGHQGDGQGQEQAGIEPRQRAARAHDGLPAASQAARSGGMPLLKVPSLRTIQGTALTPRSWAVISRRCAASTLQPGACAMPARLSWRR